MSHDPLPQQASHPRTEDALSERLHDVRDTLVSLSHDLHAHPELGFAEHRSARLLEELLSTSGFTVTAGAYGLPTAFEATLGTGPFRVVLCAEYDALPNIGHACGHNVIATIAIGAALLLAPDVDALGITLVVLGTPAEEHGGGKAIMLDNGAWEGATISMMVHGGPGPIDVSCAETAMNAVDRFDVKYHGRAAHAAGAPFLGINAGDAATLALSAIGLLRQQLKADVRMNAIIAHGGDETNIIPAETLVRAEVRAPHAEELEAVKQRMVRCFEAGAIATGCTWEMERSEPRYEDVVQNPVLAALWDSSLQSTGREIAFGKSFLGGSTDMGNVTHHVPGIHPSIAFLGTTSTPHTPQFASDAAAPTGDQAALDGALALARTVREAASNPQTRADLLATSAKRERA